MNRSSLLIPCLILLLPVAGPAGAESRFPERGVYVGPYLGAHLPTDPWAVGTSTTGATQIDTGAVIGARVGGAVFRWLGFEANLGYLPLETLGGDTVHVVDAAAGVWGQWDAGPIAIQGRFGFGLYGTGDGVTGADADWHTFLGFAVKYPITDKIVLRFDTRHTFADGLVDDTAHVFEFAFGVDFWLWVPATP